MEIRRLVIFIVSIICFSITVESQITANDFTILTSGLSEEYATRFKLKDKETLLANLFNNQNITRYIAPIIIKVSYENGEGTVTAEINYDHDKIFSESSEYTRINKNFAAFKKGISVWLQAKIFTALSQYLQAVASNGYLRDKDILKFDSAIKMTKSNGDWILFYAYNYPKSNGFYSYAFYKNVHMNIRGKIYETEADVTESLQEYSYFFVGKTKGLDGKKTGAYYFCNFFRISIEELGEQQKK